MQGLFFIQLKVSSQDNDLSVEDDCANTDNRVDISVDGPSDKIVGEVPPIENRLVDQDSELSEQGLCVNVTKRENLSVGGPSHSNVAAVPPTEMKLSVADPVM